jgi:hypothetical protein
MGTQAKEWEQTLSLYGWLPSLDGTLTFKIPTQPDGSTEANVIDSLDAVFMGSYEARKDKWIFLTDLIYLEMSGGGSGIIPSVTWDTKLTTKLFSFYGGYNLVETNKMQFDLIGGMRYFSLDTSATRGGGFLPLLNRTYSTSIDNYDAVIGFKGSYSLNENWYIPYQFDIGGGDSDLTWQANASLAYRFDWGDIIATYRYIHYDKGTSLLVEDFDLYGPKVGVVFHF